MENKSILEEVKKILDKHLEIKGLRKTPERYAIINEIYSFDHHFDADELYSQMIKKKYRVSRATIYNTLELLVSLELVTRHVFKDNLAKIESEFSFLIKPITFDFISSSMIFLYSSIFKFMTFY